MKNYTNTTETYLRSAGLKKVYLRDSRGELRLSLKTDKQIAELKARRIRIYDSATE